MRRPCLLPSFQSAEWIFARPSYSPHSRSFLNSSSNASSPQTLQARRTLPYPASTLFKVVASVESYPAFLPFILSSNITARDKNEWPSQASLEVGYAGFQETFTSSVRCDPEHLVVEAISGDKLRSSSSSSSSSPSPSPSPITAGPTPPGGVGDEGLFEFLRTRWALTPLGNKQGTDVDLQIEVKFKSALYGAMMQAASPGVAGLVIKAFETRVEEVMKGYQI